MAAPVQTTVEQHRISILANYGSTAAELGYSQDELLAAFALSDRYPTDATLSVRGIDFSSHRYEVGVITPHDRSRGGLELTGGVTSEKILGKAGSMFPKQIIVGMGDVGGKGGICATREELADIGPEGRQQLLGQHALAHNINPFDNVTATDINTFTPDMDAVATALKSRYGHLAGAAASGVSQELGGEPDLQAPRTGWGGSIVLDEYLRNRAIQGDQQVIEAINGEKPLLVLIQALGKAGMPFLESLPPYVQVKGVLEQHGAIVAHNGHLDRTMVAELARATKLNEQAVGGVENAYWLPPSERSAFWATAGVNIIVPAFDRDQFDAEDAREFGGKVVGCLANNPVTQAGMVLLEENGVDLIPGERFNVGGTLSSRLIWNKFMGPNTWTPQGYRTAWEQGMRKIAGAMIADTRQARLEQGRFVSISKATDRFVVQQAVQRLRAAA